MKVSMATFAVLAAAMFSIALAIEASGAKAVTEVVKLLEEMLDKNKAEAETERELYAKFKCYCDENGQAKTTSVEDLTTQIGMLESQIEAVQGSSGRLSIELAQLKAAIDANQASRDGAEALRAKAKEAFAAEETDLTAALASLTQAIEVLAALGSDQTLSDAGDHKRFMAGYKGSLVRLGASVKKALLAASTLLRPADQQKVRSFLQAPFTGNYAAQSGEIIGILKNMKETFSANLESARAAENAAVEAHSTFMETKLAESATLKSSYEQKQTEIGSDDADLAAKKTQLSQAQEQKTNDQDFLSKLQVTCADRSKEYDARNLLRANEQAAISQAIAILNSDSAFETFGTVKATSGAGGAPALFQRAVRRHISTLAKQRQSEGSLRAQQILREAARSQHSARLGRVAAFLMAGNPFIKVLAEIQKMKEVIDKEAKVDKSQLDWCKSEREIMNGNLDAKTTEINDLNSAITTLVSTIDHPETGLKKTIQTKEESLVANSKSQADETKDRRAEEKAYRANMANLVEAGTLLEKAIKVLEKFYDEVAAAAAASLLQARTKEDPSAPEPWTGSFAGQSEKSKTVIGTLQFILTETKKEEEAAHADENSAQIAYEDSMTLLKEQESELQRALVEAQKLLADTEQELAAKRAELAQTEQEKITIERYLERIKPGCDFITSNFDARETNRGQETQALDKVSTLLKESPAFKAAEAAAKTAGFGSCKDICTVNEAHADCKACLAGVSVPGYCAGHPGTAGC